MEKKELLSLLQKLVIARGPSGQEEEIRTLCEGLLKPLCDSVETDASGNLIGHLRGRDPSATSCCLLAHLDELALMVKRVEPTGRLRVIPLGGFFPFNFGQGPVEILASKGSLFGALSFGCMHTSKETRHIHHFKPKEAHGQGEAIEWEDVTVVTGHTAQELKKLGVHAGTRIVLPSSRRQIVEIGDYWGSYFFDDRCGIATLLCLLHNLRKKRKALRHNLSVIFTTNEEIGAMGARFAASKMREETKLIAIDVGPVAEEYGTILSSAPIIVFKDSFSVYNRSLAEQLLAVAATKKIDVQTAIFQSYGSDASAAFSQGSASTTALLTLPTENTHGFELIHQNSINETANLLEAFLINI